MSTAPRRAIGPSLACNSRVGPLVALAALCGLANRVREMITGVIIIVAVALDRLRHRRGVGW
jgi:ribose/xylose/arabinose/galactoside ABC-type transport system permease subunit